MITNALNPSNLSLLLTFARKDYYGAHSDVIVDAVFTYLCRNASKNEELQQCFDVIDEDFVGIVVGSDCFFVEGEMQRYRFFRDVVMRRVVSKMKDLEIEGDEDSTDDEKTLVPSFARSPLPSIKCGKRVLTTADDGPYSTLQLSLSQSIIYSHLSFNELLEVRHDGLIPNSTIETALWRQRELIHYIQNPESTSTLPIDTSDEAGIVPISDTAKIDTRKLCELMVPCKYGASTNPPFRFGAEFNDLGRLHAGLRVYSDEFYYLGNLWVVYLQKIMVDGVAKLGCYLQRNPYWSDEVENGDRFGDHRASVKAWFKIFCFVVQESGSNDSNSSKGSRCYILESKPDVFNVSQSWGWRSAKLYREAFLNEVSIANSLRCCVCMGQC